MEFLKEDFLRWAEKALADYPLQIESLCFLGHSDNLTFRVEDRHGELFLLRIHYPVIAYYDGVRQQPDRIASELAWLEALADVGGFHVQRPVHNSQGGLLTQVEVAEGQSLPCTLLTWLEGAHFSPAGSSAEALVEQFGVLSARLHQFSSRWTPPPGFARPSYDFSHFKRIFARLLRGANLGIFSEEAYRTLRATTQAILSEIEQLPGDPDHWGMIHADLHVGNFLVQDGEIIPIDFSFCGFGHYLFDLSICLAGGLKADLRPAFLRGYRSQRSLPESDLRPVEAYALAGRFSYYAYQVDNPTERSWLQRRIPEVVENDCKKFLNGDGIVGNL
jgi:Ser/Thr protein kinase RdoA (MazF antagonist)